MALYRWKDPDGVWRILKNRKRNKIAKSQDCCCVVEICDCETIAQFATLTLSITNKTGDCSCLPDSITLTRSLSVGQPPKWVGSWSAAGDCMPCDVEWVCGNAPVVSIGPPVVLGEGDKDPCGDVEELTLSCAFTPTPVACTCEPFLYSMTYADVDCDAGVLDGGTFTVVITA